MSRELQMQADEVERYLAEVFPQTGGRFRVVELEPMRARVRMTADDAHLRPGGTVSGPTLFTLADLGMYVATLGMIGRRALAVTTHCSIDFMRKPGPGGLEAEVELLKLGRALVVGDVRLFSDGVQGPVARASLTYSIPPDRS